jgi:hypothetical protein
MMPDYKTNDPVGWCGDRSRGAAMGRAVIREAPRDVVVKLYLRKVRLSGDYDSLGTYWGYTRGTSIYWVADADGLVDFCVRVDGASYGRDRWNAKQEVLKHYPNAKFFR